jgi:hypothetical protein
MNRSLNLLLDLAVSPTHDVKPAYLKYVVRNVQHAVDLASADTEASFTSVAAVAAVRGESGRSEPSAPELPHDAAAVNAISWFSCMVVSCLLGACAKDDCWKSARRIVRLISALCNWDDSPGLRALAFTLCEALLSHTERYATEASDADAMISCDDGLSAEARPHSCDAFDALGVVFDLLEALVPVAMGFDKPRGGAQISVRLQELVVKTRSQLLRRQPMLGMRVWRLLRAAARFRDHFVCEVATGERAKGCMTRTGARASTAAASTHAHPAC